MHALDTSLRFATFLVRSFELDTNENMQNMEASVRNHDTATLVSFKFYYKSLRWKHLLVFILFRNIHPTPQFNALAIISPEYRYNGTGFIY